LPLDYFFHYLPIEADIAVSYIPWLVLLLIYLQF